MYKDRHVVAQLVRRAERAGFKAIALTVDTPRLGRREADIKNRWNFSTLDSFFKIVSVLRVHTLELRTSKNDIFQIHLATILDTEELRRFGPWKDGHGE